MNISCRTLFYDKLVRGMPHKNERVELEMKMLKARQLARGVTDEATRERLEALAAELEQKLRAMDT
jgi:hypothetical protein